MIDYYNCKYYLGIQIHKTKYCSRGCCCYKTRHSYEGLEKLLLNKQKAVFIQKDLQKKCMTYPIPIANPVKIASAAMFIARS